MKICAISDTHWMYEDVDVPECDLLLHAGDLEVKNYREMAYFAGWWNKIPAKHKVLTPGNHDFFAENNDISKHLDNTIVLINETCRIEHLCIVGTPYTPTFLKWAFMCDDDKMAPYFSCITNEADIILSHGPLHGIHDYVRNKFAPLGINVGSKTLFDIVNKLDEKKKRYLFQGHIHQYQDSRRHTTLNSVEIYNTALCDENYKIVREPLVLEI